MQNRSTVSGRMHLLVFTPSPVICGMLGSLNPLKKLVG